MVNQKFAPLCIAVLLAVTTSGCNDGPKLYTVVGSVSFQGDTVSKGTIICAPVDGIGPAATGEIVDGRFSILTTAGEKTVRISATKETGRMILGAMDQQYPEEIDIVPPRYNSASTLVRTIDPDGGLEINFRLE